MENEYVQEDPKRGFKEPRTGKYWYPVWNPGKVLTGDSTTGPGTIWSVRDQEWIPKSHQERVSARHDLSREFAYFYANKADEEWIRESEKENTLVSALGTTFFKTKGEYLPTQEQPKLRGKRKEGTQERPQVPKRKGQDLTHPLNMANYRKTYRRRYRKKSYGPKQRRGKGKGLSPKQYKLYLKLARQKRGRRR